MNENRRIRIGWAQTDITPSRPVMLAGQLYARVSRYVHDPITATALAIDSGKYQLLFISADMVSVPTHVLDRLRGASWSDGLRGESISMSVTHTHNSCAFHNVDGPKPEKTEDIEFTLPRPEDQTILDGREAEDYLYYKLKALVDDAWRGRTEGGISYAQDYAAVAFNRRPVFDIGDGKTESKMYGCCAEDNFVRLEGPSDHTADMLYTWDKSGNLTGVAVDIPCPSQVYELHCFVSADYWGEARDQIRERLGNIYILSLCGAAGDQNPLDLVRISKTNREALKLWNAQEGEVFRDFDMLRECRSIGERIAEAVARGYKTARNRIRTEPVFRHVVKTLALPIRQVTEADYIEAKAELERLMAAKEPFIRLFEPLGVVKRWEQQNVSPDYEFDFHAVRIDEAAFVTCPFELFTEYGLRIRARSRSEQTFIIQLANGRGGYLPTRAAIDGGSYSSKPASTVCGGEGGDKLVEEALAAIAALWEREPDRPRRRPVPKAQ